ncbi:MAG: hypothetical protein KA085_06420 [Phenylobacterium sp.]|jgi:hypothetical protein|uniref:oxidoreductase-like domain-containing protein n=1 Tax=Phenylobacterium sp. TaxID=1871053 RepID=UPI001B6F7563|nr:oxidoreductase-like domain-containing protein [Phenylobacterium sp.]MBP7650315.1 hypothetical protein [Phenylobacterium sp.]MBP7815741.1 hypothetical protein [Phenylobacterium sp.]MBP9755651.1 hypothetical protein [Phenylobacterium sp.]
MTDQPAVPKRPTKPDPMECCRRGCYPCIFDYHDTATERWEARVRALGLDPDAIPVED